MKSPEIRRAFLDFFRERGHRVVPSASLVPVGDPTLMFVNAGMVPFKRVLLGEEQRDYRRAVSVQKVMRVSGKHNDLENVGHTPRHHTFFEMLGNFSFGDYFKEQAIEYAWEFLTGVAGLPAERLHASVLRGDDEAAALWRDRIGLPESRIYPLPESENWWQMGDTGPCGPCSEIHVQRRALCGPDCDPSCDCGAWLEVWNLVFMQYEQRADGSRVPLEQTGIDTGMGLERLASALQDTETDYETDAFMPLIRRAAEISGRSYHDDPDTDVSLKVVADHARACTFLIGDGVLPSNEGRGYVVRRVLRRAARHGVLLGIEEPFLHELADTVVAEMGGAYPELRERRPFIRDTIRAEEERFGRTLGRGLALLDEAIADARREGRSVLAGDVVFRLYDTYGFPTDLSEDILRGRGLDYDRGGFAMRMREQSERARAAWKGSGQTAPPEVYGAVRARLETRFTGYETLEAHSEIGALIRDGVEVHEVAEGDRVELAVPVTPFYAESGGQVGDEGEIEGPDGRLLVEDTRRPVDDLVVHAGRVALGRLRVGDAVTLRVDADRRAATVRNHSGTHLLHWALREVLGPQVTQAGSLVAPDRLRFDFTHDRPLTDDEIRRIEDLVNGLILENVPARVEHKPYREAMDEGVVAIFEEKYGDVVRVVRFGPSLELCGGTHARATGDIGLLRIVSQAAIGAGVRRIEAQTGLGAVEVARRESRALRDAAAVLRAAPSELPERVRQLVDEQKRLTEELEKAREKLRSGGARDPLQHLREVAGVKLIAAEVDDASPKELRGLVDDLKNRMGSGVVLLGARRDGKAAIALGVTRDLSDRFRAGDLIKEVASLVGGSGGGRPDFAQAGGSAPEALPQALERFVDLVRESAEGAAPGAGGS